MTSRSLTEMVSLHLPHHAACAPHSVLEYACVCRLLKPGPALSSLFAALDRGESLSLWGRNDARQPERRAVQSVQHWSNAQYFPLAGILAWSIWSKWSKHFFTVKIK